MPLFDNLTLGPGCQAVDAVLVPSRCNSLPKLVVGTTWTRSGLRNEGLKGQWTVGRTNSEDSCTIVYITVVTATSTNRWIQTGSLIHGWCATIRDLSAIFHSTSQLQRVDEGPNRLLTSSC